MRINNTGDGRYRNAEIHFRCTKEQRKFIKMKAKLSGKSLSDFMIESAYSSKIIYNKLDFNCMKEISYEMNKIGNNINQIVKIIHEKGDAIDEQNILSIAEEVATLRDEVTERMKESCDMVKSMEIDFDKIADELLKGDLANGIYEDIEN